LKYANYIFLAWFWNINETYRFAFCNITGISTPTLFVGTADKADLYKTLRKTIPDGDKNYLCAVKVVE
jgi:hypothetical protein